LLKIDRIKVFGAVSGRVRCGPVKASPQRAIARYLCSYFHPVQNQVVLVVTRGRHDHNLFCEICKM